jgi:hypothetical protein
MDVLVPVRIENLGRLIKTARLTKFPGESLAAVARRANIPRQHWQRIEEGQQRAITLNTVLAIQETLGENWVDESPATPTAI